MRYLLCAIISYLIGTFNPSYIVGVKKSINVKEKGSKNAGASNALILFGKVVGVVCALLDIGKACLAIALCRKIFSGLSYVFAIAGGRTVALEHRRKVFCYLFAVFLTYLCVAVAYTGCQQGCEYYLFHCVIKVVCANVAVFCETRNCGLRLQ